MLFRSSNPAIIPSSSPPISIVIPYFCGKRGNPILFAASYVHEVAMGERHIGCKKLANEYPDDVFRYETSHDRFTTDMDTPDDYARMLARLHLRETPEPALR